jgi:hypothetical protein
MRLIQFLNEKNHFLEKFFSLNEKQISLLESGQFDEIEKFYNQREDLLKILKYIDAEIYKAHMSNKESQNTFTEQNKQDIRETLRAKEIYVRKILDQDLIVLSLIDEAKSKIIKELQEVQKARKALAGYRSPAA